MTHKQLPASTQKPSHLKDLLLLFAIPTAIAVFAAVVVYVPRLLANPTYDFIYVYCGDYRCRDSYLLDGDHRIVRNADNDEYYDSISSLRYYDAEQDATRALTLEEATQYELDGLSKSPDGYTLVREETDSGFLFWGEYDAGWYLKNGTKKQKVTLATQDSYYDDEIDFLGWVKQ